MINKKVISIAKKYKDDMKLPQKAIFEKLLLYNQVNSKIKVIRICLKLD